MNETSASAESRPPPSRARLRCLVYVSTASHDFSPSELSTLMEEAAAYNRTLSVTGLLLYADRNIMQCLEGPPDGVRTVFERVRQSRRHHSVSILFDELVPHHAFPDWSMALAHAVDHEALNESKAQWRERVRRALDEPHLGLSLMRRFWLQQGL